MTKAQEPMTKEIPSAQASIETLLGYAGHSPAGGAFGFLAFWGIP